MTELKTLTLTGTANNSLADLTIELKEGQTMILKHARIEIVYTGALNYPRTINVLVGNASSTDYVIDNDAGYNYMKVGLSYNPITDTTNFRNISVTYPDTGFKIFGRINKNCQIALYDENHIPLTGLVYYFLQFIIV